VCNAVQDSAFVAVPAAMAAAADLPPGGLILLSMSGKKVGMKTDIDLYPFRYFLIRLRFKP